MMLTYDPTTAEFAGLRTAIALLAEAIPGFDAEAYDLQSLATIVYRLDGAYAIDIKHGSYLAEVRPQGVEGGPRGQGIGWSPEVALLLALAQAVPRISPETLKRRLRA